MEEQPSQPQQSTQPPAQQNNDFQPTVTPAGDFQPQPPATKPPKKSKLWIIVLVVVVLIIAGAATVLFLLRDKEESNEEVSSNRVAESASEEVDTNDFGAELQSIAEEVAANYSGTNTDYIDDEARSVVLQDEAAAIYVAVASPDKWSGMLDFPEVTNDLSAAYDAFIAALEGRNFTDYDFANPFILDEEYVYMSDGNTVCAVEQYGGDRLFYSCSELSELPEASASIQPFYSAYQVEYPVNEADGEYLINVKLSNIEESSFEGYEIVGGGIGYASGGGAYVAYYRVNGGDWVYGISGQDMPNCDDFADDVDKQKAFADRDCSTNESGDTTLVKDYFNL